MLSPLTLNIFFSPHFQRKFSLNQFFVHWRNEQPGFFTSPIPSGFFQYICDIFTDRIIISFSPITLLHICWKPHTHFVERTQLVRNIYLIFSWENGKYSIQPREMQPWRSKDRIWYFSEKWSSRFTDNQIAATDRVNIHSSLLFAWCERKSNYQVIKIIWKTIYSPWQICMFYYGGSRSRESRSIKTDP